MDLPSTPKQRGKLLDFLNLLLKWNRVYNLTAIDRPEDMVRLHLLDSLAILPHLHGGRVLDVGTGAGLPGIPLALLAPEREFTLLDSNAKKTRFVQQAAIELGLGNVTVEQTRVERFVPPIGFDTILSRAFSGLADIVRQTARLLNPGGVILAQKGRLPEPEIRQLNDLLINIIPLAVPGIDAERHLIAIKLLD